VPTPAFLSRARRPAAVRPRPPAPRTPPRFPGVPSARPAAALVRLRAAVTALFVLDGAVFGTWASRVPDVAARVGANHSALGVALLCLSLGALVLMRVTGSLCGRFGAGPVSAAAALAVCATAVLPGLVPSVAGLCAALFVFGGATGMINVSANALGVQVEAQVGRPLLSGLHAGFSLGGLGGALVGGIASSVLNVPVHLGLVALTGLLVTAWALPSLLGAPPEPVHASVPRERGGARPTAVLVVLGAIAGCTAFGEGALTDWGALLLRQHLAAPATLAAAGYAGFALAMACGRLFGGRLLVAFGERRLLVGGTLLAAVGALAAVTTSSLGIALAGFALVGLGLANVFPLAIARAGLLGGASGIALATTVGYTGLLGGPPAIGFLAERAGLPVALSSVALLAVLAAVLVVTVSGDMVRMPAPRAVLNRAVTGVGGRLQPVVSGFGHGTGVYLRELEVLWP
jgi:MFS family permease